METLYTVYSQIDYQDFGSFKTRKEAFEHIKELKRFDKDMGNPFDEEYIVMKEVFE